MTSRALLGAVTGVLALVALTSIGSPEASRAVTIQPCAGPRAINPNPDSARYIVHEEQHVLAVFGLNCVPSGDTVSSTPLRWGDGASSQAVVTYVINSGGADKQA